MFYPLRALATAINPSFSYVNDGAIYRAVRNTRIPQLANFGRSYAKTERFVRNHPDEPSYIAMEITGYCQRRCNGCYIPLEERKDGQVMDIGTARKVVKLGHSLGMSLYNLMGGESLSDQTIPVIDAITKENPSSSFYSCTNGDYLATTPEKAKDLILRNNLSFAFSIDGFRDTNDSLRGKGSYESVVASAECMSAARSFFGAVTTLRAQNYEEATSDDFMDFLIGKGFTYMLFSFPDDCGIDMEKHSGDVMKKLSGKPIFIYDGKLGHNNIPGSRKEQKDLYVAKNGDVFVSRKKRSVIGNLDTDIETLYRNGDWQARFAD